MKVKCMYRGIRCHIANEYGQYLGRILEPVDLAKYVWMLEHSEAYFVKEKGEFEDFFTDYDYKQGIQGNDLQNRLLAPSYYTIFVNLQAYKSDLTPSIITYEDFL